MCSLQDAWTHSMYKYNGSSWWTQTLCCFVVYSTRRFVVCLSVCHFVLVFFSPFSIAITSLGEERANLSAFRTFVRFVLVFRFFWYCDCLAWGGWGWSWCFSCVCWVCACLGLSVSSSSWGLGRAAVCDCGTPWTFLLPFFSIRQATCFQEEP